MSPPRGRLASALRASLLAAIVCTLSVGCVTSKHPKPAQIGRATQDETKPVTPSGLRPTSTTTQTTDTRPGTPTPLPVFKVQEWAFADFGLSVKTNFEVAVGEHVQWMEVTSTEPNSSARNAGLLPGERILAINSQQVTGLTKSGLEEYLFRRKKGEQVRLLVLGSRHGLPRFVSLVAARP